MLQGRIYNRWDQRVATSAAVYNRWDQRAARSAAVGFAQASTQGCMLRKRISSAYRGTPLEAGRRLGRHKRATLGRHYNRSHR
jgi:hypothetical protein